MINKLLLIFIFFTGNIFSQPAEERVNLTLLIDDILIEGINVIEGEIILGSNRILFRYETGDILLSKEDLLLINSMDQNSDIEINFIYFISYPNYFKKKYTIKTKLHWINQRYSILKIYNFDNKRNRKYFLEREGYGFEIFRPALSKILPRKRRIKAGDLLRVRH